MYEIALCEKTDCNLIHTYLNLMFGYKTRDNQHRKPHMTHI